MQGTQVQSLFGKIPHATEQLSFSSLLLSPGSRAWPATRETTEMRSSEHCNCIEPLPQQIESPHPKKKTQNNHNIVKKKTKKTGCLPSIPPAEENTATPRPGMLEGHQPPAKKLYPFPFQFGTALYAAPAPECP